MMGVLVFSFCKHGGKCKCIASVSMMVSVGI